MLGNNMFAYCLNNPTNAIDPTGFATIQGVSSFDDSFRGLFFGIGGGGNITSGIVGALVTEAIVGSLLTTTAIIKNTTAEEKQDSIVITDTLAANEQSTAIYYGADTRGGSWKIVTPEMSAEQATAWVISMSAANVYGKKASWGLYTANRSDAERIVMTLGGPGPCLHENRIGEYPHFHPMGMMLFGQYKHFHVWYGSIYGG